MILSPSARRRIRVPLLIAMSIALGSCASAKPQKTGTKEKRQLVIISIDGLRPEFFQSFEFDTPTLKKLATQGASVETLFPIYPSVTYPNHTSLITGVNSNRHGIESNYQFDPSRAPLAHWYWDSKKVKAQTLWQLAVAHSKKVAILGWPVSVGAEADWVIPEIFPVKGFDPRETWNLTRERTHPALWSEAEKAVPGGDYQTPARRDEWFAQVAAHILKKYRPDLTLIHLTSVDLAQHWTGRDSPDTREAIRHADRQIAEILRSVDLDSTYVIVVGDHGFQNVRNLIHVNALLSSSGWLREDKGRLIEWKAIGRLSGGQTAIYLKDPKSGPAVRKLIEKSVGKYVRIFDRAELDRLGAFPGAAFAIDPLPDYGIGSKLSGSWLEPLKKVRGDHGMHPEAPGMQTGLILVGPQVPAGKRIAQAQLIDVAPTAARLIGLELQNTDGKPIPIEINDR